MPYILTVVWLIIAAADALAFRRCVAAFTIHSLRPQLFRKWLRKHRCFLLERDFPTSSFRWSPRIKRLLATYMLFALILPIVPPPSLMLAANWVNCLLIEERLSRRKFDMAKQRITAAKVNGLIVVGINGSFGKTAFATQLETLLSGRFKVQTVANAASAESIAGYIIECLRPRCNVLIVPIPIIVKGDGTKICDFILPDYGVVTAVSGDLASARENAHQLTLQPIDATADAVFELIDTLDPTSGAAFFNWEDERVQTRALLRLPSYFDEQNDNHKLRVVKYGVQNANANFSAEAIKVSEVGTSFRLQGESYSTRLIGKRGIVSLTGAIAASRELSSVLSARQDSLITAELVKCVARIKPVPNRLQLGYLDTETETLLINDSASTSPESAEDALDALNAFHNRFKVLITHGLPGVDKTSRDEQTFTARLDFGRKAAEVCDLVILIGEHPEIRAGLRANGLSDDQISVAVTEKEALAIANELPNGVTAQKLVILIVGAISAS